MSIYGPGVSLLQLCGTTGRRVGLLYRRLVIPLSLNLPIAGPSYGSFSPNALQSCQWGNAGIQVVVYALDQLGNPADISAASVKTLRFQRPDGTAFSLTALFLTNGMDGGLYYTTTDSDFVQTGTWSVQASFLLAGDKKTTQWGQFTVGPNIAAP